MGNIGPCDPCIVVDELKLGFELEHGKKGASVSLVQCPSFQKAQRSSKHAEGSLSDCLEGKDDSIDAKGNKNEDNSDTAESIIWKNEYINNSDKERSEMEYQDSIVCFEKDAHGPTEDLCIDFKHFSDCAILQNKVRQNIIFFNQLTNDEKYQSRHMIPSCNELKQNASESDFKCDVDQFVTQDFALEYSLNGKNKTTPQTFASTSDQNTCSIGTASVEESHGRLQAELPSFNRSSKKSSSLDKLYHQQILSVDLEDLMIPSLSRNFHIKCNENFPKLLSGSPTRAYSGTEVLAKADFLELRSPIDNSIHSEASSSESDKGMASRKNSLVHYDEESSTSDSGMLSIPLSYSGRFQFSGSISMLSDGSTSSTGSFAFPILQSEWTSSPVRMEKSHPTHYSRHRGWSLRLLCCRFLPCCRF